MAGIFATPGAGLVLTFTDTSERVMYSEDTSFAREQNFPFEIHNDSGLTWTDFHVVLEGDSPFGEYLFMRFVDLGSDSVIYTGPGTAAFSDANADVLGYNEVLDITGLSIPDGGVLSFTADFFGGAAPEGMTSYEILGRPTANNQPPPSVPDAGATLLLLGCALTGLAGLQRKW